MKAASIILRDTGAILLVVGVVSIFALIPSLIYNELEHTVWILATAGIFLLIGGFFRLVGRGDGDPKIKHAMVIAALSWLIISLISSIPFMYIEKMDFFFCLF